jgi:hypothetical protein
MAERTQELFQEEISKLATKEDLGAQTEELASIINSGFQSEHGYIEQRFDELRDLVRLRNVVAEHEKKFQKIAEALRIEL